MTGNFVDLILRHERERPEAVALVLPTAWTGREVTAQVRVTFGELGARVRATRARLHREGFTKGDRVVVMFPVGLELYALVLGLLAGGMAAVLIDTGMGARKVLHSVRVSGATGLVSMKLLLRHRWWLPALWKPRKYCVDGSGLFMRPAERLLGAGDSSDDGVGDDRDRTADVDPDEHALITFTSGSTGNPKGADRTHGLLTAQHEALAEHFPEEPGEVDMPCFPVVTLHNLCCGIPTVLPPVDFRAVAEAPAAAVWSFAAEHGVTRMSGAPAYVDRLVRWLEESPGTSPPPSLRRLGVGGARVPASLCERTLRALPGVQAQVLYGSTEAEPIASVGFEEVLASRGHGEGVLVGEAATAATVRLVDLPDPPPPLDQRGVAPFEVADGQTGELIVAGPHVNRGYLDDPAADRANKLYAPDGAVWHRTGDVARRDERGRIWLTGRVKDLVRVGDRIVHPFAIEEALDVLDGVRRAALVQVDDAVSLVALELRPGADEEAVTASARAVLVERELGAVPVVPVDSIPVDGRHNSKIDRPALRDDFRVRR